MPEKEFEIYLSLLGRLLRLSPSQKAAISDELRDHLEERLTSLLHSGLTRDEAIQKAMEEFGDVTGLALDLTRVSRTPIRKIVMRSTIAASVTAAAVVLWVTMFVPEHRIAAPVAVQAQQNKPVAAVEPVKERERRQEPVSPTGLHDKELFPAFLEKQTDVSFSDVPLKEICEFLESLHDVPVKLHRSALNDEGISGDTPVSLSLTGLSFEEVLNHLTRKLNLTWQVDGDLVQITTNDANLYRTRHFDLHKLTKAGHSLNGLKEVLRLASSKWEDDGDGQGTMALIGESIIIRQTCLNQRRIAQVLAAIEQQRPMTVLGTCSNRGQLLDALQEPGTAEFSEIPLAEVIAFLSERHKVPILIDTQALADEGVSHDTPVTLFIKNRPLAKLLDLFLSDLHMTWQVRDGVIRVTTNDRADNDLMWIAYNVHDLASNMELLTQLSDAIEQTTNGQWQDVQGQGGQLALTDVGGLLLISQTDQIHFEIQTLLDQLRHSRKERQGESDKGASRPKLVAKSYQMPKEIATDLHKSLQNLVAPNSWLPSDGERPMIELVASMPQLDQVEGLVSGGDHEVRVLNHPPEKPKVGEKPGTPAPATIRSIVVRPRSALVIRQTPEVHREIQKVLQNLGVVAEIHVVEPGGRSRNTGGGMGGGGGGFF